MSVPIQKVKLLQFSPDLSSATFQIHDESHTVGNALRWIIMKNPKVELCGYDVPHPSENVINVRIQMYDNLSALDALITGLTELDKICEAVEDGYLDSLREGKFERWAEKR